MRRYEQTYLFHKVKTMQHVNGSLASPNTDSQFMHLVWGISTLCLTEVCTPKHLSHAFARTRCFWEYPINPPFAQSVRWATP
jgi:hypothetical protein